MAIPFWVGKYIGIKFAEVGRDRAGVDCWGLVRLIFMEQYDIALPSYCSEYKRTIESVKIENIISRESQHWKPINIGEEKFGDVIVMLVRGKPMHVGFVLEDKTMLHAEMGRNSCIEKYNSVHWEHRISGFYRNDRFI